MSFMTRAQDAQRGRKGGQCTAGQALDSFLPEYRAQVTAALADLTIYSSVIASILAEDGYEIAAETLNRHRRGRCKCER